MKFSFFLVLIFVLGLNTLSAQQEYAMFAEDARGKQWVDSVYAKLSQKERVAQLFWISVEGSDNAVNVSRLAQSIKANQPGGLVFLKAHPTTLVSVSNYFQSLSKVPLTVALDAEWGLGMRLDSVISYPYQMTLGAIQDNTLIHRMGSDIGEQLRRIGVTVNLAPVADVNNNPNNPVIGRRSFGENPLNVSEKALAYINGLQAVNVLAVAKHFPGHGDTDTDSHKTLPQIMHSKARLDTVELVPFKYLINHGLKAIMSAHLEIPALEPRKGYPSGVSYDIVTKLLKEELGFKGLVVTDAVNMQGAKVFGEPGNIDLAALQAGNDIVEFTENLPLAIQKVEQAILNKQMTQRDLEIKCKRVLAVKYASGLNNYKDQVTKGLYAELNTGRYHQFNRDLYAAALTVVGNKKEFLPLKNLDTQKTVAVTFGKVSEWRKLIVRYQLMDVIDGSTAAGMAAAKRLASTNQRVILVLEDAKALKANVEQVNLFNTLVKNPNTCLVYTGNPYYLSRVGDLSRLEAVVLTYQTNEITRDLATQLVFGAVGATGRMPVSVNALLKYGMGVDVLPIRRLKYGLPESVGLDGAMIQQKVDSIVSQAIEKEAFPGCEVLVAIKGTVIFNKSYGYHTYDNTQAVAVEDLYDIASVTKIAGALPLLMKAYEEGRVDLDKPMATYWGDWQQSLFHKSNKQTITLREVLAHQAGLQPFFSTYPKSFKEGTYSPVWYRFQLEDGYTSRLGDHLYLSSDFSKVIYKEIRLSKLLDEKKYKYSDLGFQVFPKMLEGLYQTDYQRLLTQQFYAPLGASSLMYNPLDRYASQQIVPTEYDSLFRHELVHGVVHDETAACLGGVSGHAGLFSNANDLAKLMQMYLQKGEYGGQRYLAEATLDEFTKTQYPQNNNRRALGFDKPLLGNDTIPFDKSYPTPEVSASSYGHQGFTGTFVWIDPDYEMVYVFLSNRVFPSRSHQNLYKLNVRPTIHQVFYKELIKEGAITARPQN